MTARPVTSSYHPRVFSSLAPTRTLSRHGALRMPDIAVSPTPLVWTAAACRIGERHRHLGVGRPGQGKVVPFQRKHVRGPYIHALVNFNLIALVAMNHTIHNFTLADGHNTTRSGRLERLLSDIRLQVEIMNAYKNLP
jgi:hypothetical protein